MHCYFKVLYWFLAVCILLMMLMIPLMVNAENYWLQQDLKLWFSIGRPGPKSGSQNHFYWLSRRTFLQYFTHEQSMKALLELVLMMFVITISALSIQSTFKSIICGKIEYFRLFSNRKRTLFRVGSWLVVQLRTTHLKHRDICTCTFSLIYWPIIISYYWLLFRQGQRKGLHIKIVYFI